MAEERRKRKTLDPENIRAGRALGKSYAQIGRELGVDPSSVWYALNRKPGASTRPVPAGTRRTAYVSDERYAHVEAIAARSGLSWSAALGEVIDRDIEWCQQNQPLELEPAIAGADA